MSERLKLAALFQRQRWRPDDRAEDVGLEVDVDLAPFFFSADLAALNFCLTEIRNNPMGGSTQDTDHLAEEAGLFKGFKKNDTGYLSVRPADLEEFLSALGGPTSGALTEADRAAMRRVWDGLDPAPSAPGPRR